MAEARTALQALDVSGSMGSAMGAGNMYGGGGGSSMSCHEAAAAMALVTLRGVAGSGERLMNIVYPPLHSHTNRRSWQAPWHPAATFCLFRIVVHDIELLENRQHIGIVVGARATGETGLLYNPILGADARAVASRVGVKIPSMLTLPAPGQILSSSERAV